MAKDDYTRIVCLILTYLYARLRGRIEMPPEAYLQPMTKDFPIEEEYFNFILDKYDPPNLDGRSTNSFSYCIFGKNEYNRVR